MADSYDHLMGTEQDAADHPDNQSFEVAAATPSDSTKYTVYNKSTGVTTYHNTIQAARRASDNQDNKYGGYITNIQSYPRLVDPR